MAQAPVTTDAPPSNGEPLLVKPAPGSAGATSSAPSKSSSGAAPVLSTAVSWRFVVLQITVAAVCGVVFGWCLNKAQVFPAAVIRDQFRFKSQIMLQVFLAAAASSMLVVTALYKFAPSVVKATGDSYRTDSIGAPATAVGGLLLGIGMAIAGSCPGTIWAQIGAGSVNSFITVGAGLMTALLYGLVYDRLKPFLAAGPITGKRSVFDYLPFGRTVTAIIFAGMLYGIVGALSLVQDMPKFQPVPEMMRWNPYLVGLIMGLLQIPLSVALYKNLGCSSSFVTLMSFATGKFTQDNAYLTKKRGGVSNWWQVTFVAAIALGSYLSAKAADTPKYDVLDDVTVPQAIIGGVFMLLGARIGSGCTSGHGISGFSHLATRSLIAVAAMFGGGIATTYAFFN